MRPRLIAVTAAALLAAVALAGCGLTPQGDFVRQAVSEQGREAAAAGLENAEWYICRASPVGAVVDRYGVSESRWGAWTTVCLDRAAAVETPPAAPGAPQEPPPATEALPPAF